MTRCRRLLAIAPALAGVLGLGWPALAAAEPAAPPVSQRIVTARPATGQLELAVEGVIDNAAPIAHHLRIAWVPFAEVIADGARVVPGEALATFDTGILRDWIARQRRELAQLAAEREVVRQRAATERDELLARGRELASAVAVIRAQWASRLAADTLAEGNARRQAELTASEADRLARRVADAESLLAEGRLSVAAVELARSAAATALARATTAQAELAAWTNGDARAAAQALASQLADAEAAVRRDQDGDESRHAVADRLVAADERSRRGELERVETELARREFLAAKPVLAAEAAGLVRWRDRSVRPGAKLATTPCVFVLDPAQMVAVVRLPEAMRDLIAPWNPQGSDGRAEVEIPGLPGAGVLAARILAIATVPVGADSGSGAADGPRSFQVTLRIDDAPGGLRPGMQVRAKLLVPLPATAAAVPRWAVVQRTDPRLVLATPEDGGEPVWVRGVATDREFIAFAGLPPRLRALATDRTQVQAPRRLAGVIEAADAVPVHLRTQDWEIIEAVPDGAPVTRGQVIGRLAKSSPWLDPEQIRWNRDSGLARADGAREAARLRARLDLLAATDAWQQAEGEALRARLGLIVQALDRQRGALAAAGGRLAAAASRLATARAGQAEAQDPRVQPTLSGNERGRRAVELAAAQAAQQQAALEAAAARHPAYAEVAQAAAAAEDAATRAVEARKTFDIARRNAAQAEDRADQAWERTIKQIDRDSDQIADEEIIAPISGRAFHPAGRPLVPGQPLATLEPFLIVPSPDGRPVRRRIALEAPAHFAGRWRAGQAVQVQVAGLGRQNGTVLTVGTWYGPSTASRAAAEAGVLAPDEPVFNLVITLDLPAALSDRALPGTSVWIDVGTETVDLGGDDDGNGNGNGNGGAHAP